MVPIVKTFRHLAWWLDYATRVPGAPTGCVRDGSGFVVRHARAVEDETSSHAGRDRVEVAR